MHSLYMLRLGYKCLTRAQILVSDPQNQGLKDTFQKDPKLEFGLEDMIIFIVLIVIFGISFSIKK